MKNSENLRKMITKECKQEKWKKHKKKQIFFLNYYLKRIEWKNIKVNIIKNLIFTLMNSYKQPTDTWYKLNKFKMIRRRIYWKL